MSAPRQRWHISRPLILSLALFLSLDLLNLPVLALNDFKDFSPRDLRNMRATRQSTAVHQDHVLHYNPAHLSAAQFKKDLPLLKPFIHLSTLRLILNKASWDTERQALITLIQAMQSAGYAVDIVLNMQGQLLTPDILSPLISLKLSALSLQAPELSSEVRSGGTDAETALWTIFLSNYRQLYQALKAPLAAFSVSPPVSSSARTKVGIWAAQMPMMMRMRHLPPPDQYLYHFQGPLYDLHTHVLRLNHYLQAPWQLAQVSTPIAPTPHHQEHEEAWLHRFLFFFSKKYGLLPAAVSLYPESYKTGVHTPSLLRETALSQSTDQRTPSYWLAHIYFHLNRIDIDEYKLTRALYMPIGGDSASSLTAEDFLKVYYKLSAERSLPDYITHKRSDLFYDFLKREAEESLLNSHFARLQSVRKPAQGSPSAFSLHFLSALGRFRFLQNLRYSDNAEITGLSPPMLASDFRVYEKVSAADLPWTRELEQSISAYPQLRLRWSLLKPLNLPQERSFSQALLLKIEAADTFASENQQTLAFPVDIQPLALQEKETGHIFIPDPLFFKFFKRLDPESFGGELGVSAILPFPESPQGFTLNVKAEPARQKSPRRLDARVMPGVNPLNSQPQTLRLILKNPFVERLFLPGLVLLAEQGQQVFVLEYILPEGLLPLEQREYTLRLPPQFQPHDPTVWSVRGAAYPVVDREINLDDAFHSDVFDLKQQALEKYSTVFAQFSDELTPEHRLSVAERLLYLSIQLETPLETERRFQHFMQTEPVAYFLPQQRVALSLGKVRAYLQQGNLSLALIKGLQRDLDQAFAEETAHFTLEDYKLWAYLQKLTGSQAALETYRKALSLALAQKNLTEINFLYGRLLEMTQAQGSYLRASQWLISWQDHPAYARLPLSLQQEHLKRLGYLAERQNKPQQAMRYYRLYLQATGSTETRLHLAQLYRQQKQIREAIATYRRYLSDCNNCDNNAYRELAYLLEATSPREAITYYERYLKQASPSAQDAPGIKNTLVNLYLAQGRPADLHKALVLNRQLLQPCGGHCGERWQRQGSLFMKLGRRAEALQAYDSALKLSFSRSLLKTVAYLAVEQNQTPLAIQRLKQLLPLTRGSEQAQLRLTLGERYRLQGNLSPLKALLAPFLTGQLPLPQDAQASVAVAQLYQSMGELKPAIALLEQEMTERSTPYQYRLLAALYRESGDFERATLWLERLKSRFPQENTLPLFRPYPLRTPAPRR
jgi:tetratricopeptide (TPR) repeat protein